MKKSILIISTIFTAISLMAFGYLNSETQSSQELAFDKTKSEVTDEPEFPFFYDYGTRFGGITKAEIQKATSIADFFPEEHAQRIVSYGKVSLIIIKNERQTNIREYSEGKMLTPAQRKLLLSSDYSTSFNLRADCKHHNPETGVLEDSFYSPHLTIVPEKQAKYINGKEALLNYLKENSKEEKAVAHQQKKLRPAKLNFTVTKNGNITNVKIGNHSGYKPIDDKLIMLIKNLPGKWIPAENEIGEKVDQELVVSYGLMGC